MNSYHNKNTFISYHTYNNFYSSRDGPQAGMDLALAQGAMPLNFFAIKFITYNQLDSKPRP